MSYQDGISFFMFFILAKGGCFKDSTWPAPHDDNSHPSNQGSNVEFVQTANYVKLNYVF